MEWIEGIIYTTSLGVEPVYGMLAEAGVEGVQIIDYEEMIDFLEDNPFNWDYVDDELISKKDEEVRVVFYVSDDAHGNETLISVKGALEALKNIEDIGFNMGRLFLELVNVDDTQWLNSWKKYYKPFKVGKKIVIKPIWEAYENHDEDIVFNINPGHVFGTGLHQSTQLCIEELEKHVKKDMKVLDLGCGSGILSIISLLLGAKVALAVDLDPNAVDVAYENAKENGVDKGRYKVISGNILTDEELSKEIKADKYAIVVANIVADVIIGIGKAVTQYIEDGGLFITSGIIEQRVEEVTEALLSYGFDIIDVRQKDSWYCVLASYSRDKEGML